MAAADLPKWGFGQQPVPIKPVSGDFIPFFSTHGASRVDADKTFLNFGSFAPVPQLTRLPAWERVPTRSLRAPGQNQKIMRRVPICNERPTPTPFFLLPTVSVVTSDRDEVGFNLALPRKMRRGNSYEAGARDASFFGVFTHAAMLSELMEAKVDVANNFLGTSSHTDYKDKVLVRRRGKLQVVPDKRRADKISRDDAADTPAKAPVEVLESPASSGGNRLKTYDAILPIIERTFRNGQDRTDVKTAAVAEFSSFMQRLRRNPRKHVAAYGVSELSDIMDMSEPESPTVVRQPVLKAESRSPQKRLARLTSPVKKSMNRLADGFVQLLPGTSRKAAASPTKSGSAPSSPVPQPSSPVLQSAVTEAAVNAHEDLTTESIDDSPARPGRTFRVPSECDSSTYDDTGLPETPNKTSSPVNFSRPIAPTPSQWNRPEPSTPFTPATKTVVFDPVTPNQASSPIGLAALIPPSTPGMLQCTYNSPSDVGSFDFAKKSPFHSSTSWMNKSVQAGEPQRSPFYHSFSSWMNTSVQASEPKRSKNVNQARRRQSEPLIRKYFESQARRRSSSPRKVRYQEEDIFRDDFCIASLFDTAVASPVKPAAVETQTATDETTIMDIDANTATQDATDINLAEPSTAADEPTVIETTAVEPTIAETTNAEQTHDASPASTDNKNEQGVVNIDMRENPDIFGTHMSSPPVSAPAPIFNLSRMADDACDGHAKVVVTEENGRLFVRFKLSAQFAHMFPPSQGFNDTLSFSPSAIASTPRPASRLLPTPTPISRSVESLLETPQTTGLGIVDSDVNEFNTPELPEHHDNTLNFASPINHVVDQPLPMSSDVHDSSIQRNEPVVPSSNYNTPKFAASMENNADQTLPVSWPDVQNTPAQENAHVAVGPNHNTPKFASMDDDADHTMPVSWPDVQATPTPTEQNNQIAADPNHNTPMSASMNDIIDHTLPVSSPGHDNPTQENDQIVTTSNTAPVADTRTEDYDSPGREYMREFIKRSRQSTATTTTTTETVSPIAPAAKRQPLGARSPNRASPLKRKHSDGAENDEASPVKKSKVEEKEPEVAKAVAKPRTKARRRKAELEITMTDLPASKSDEADTTAPVTRRSSRLRGQDNTSGAPKSSLPTPIKISRAGAGRNGGAKLPKARSEEEELVRKTRANTKKNMGNAELPAEVLVRLASQVEDDSDGSRESEGSATGRRVGWNQPLTKVQGDEPKKGRAAPKAKGKATQGEAGISKPKSTPKSTPKAKRVTKVAEDLGMVANGTPAKPQRVTRSRARSGV
ncbi:hypothetical protein F53441_10424 [Fusarium austroafricanum]|uniref:Uncharacterized protein n=1 Tax=Fusarium austroafricanum TaxID=2364996 RepID=A0A8H4NUI4_9HYPO|nr:hypothetical protein F53441_10424 [Fusarium austroafricanum]